MATRQSITWKVVEAADLRWRFWDDQFVVYSPASGDTHLLNPVAGEILRCLEQAPANLPELVRRVASRLKLDANKQLLEQIGSFLGELENFGLIEAVPS